MTLKHRLTKLERARMQEAGQKNQKEIMQAWLTATRKGLHLDYETLEELEFPEFYKRYPEQAYRLLNLYTQGEELVDAETFDELKEHYPDRAEAIWAYACERHPIPPKDEPGEKIL